MLEEPPEKCTLLERLAAHRDGRVTTVVCPARRIPAYAEYVSALPRALVRIARTREALCEERGA